MRSYGAEVILTPAKKTIEYSRELAGDMAANQGYFMLNQFANADNYGMHYKTTGPEIWRDTKGAVSHFVSAMGTTGTIMGVFQISKRTKFCHSNNWNSAYRGFIHSWNQEMVAGVSSKNIRSNESRSGH